MMKSRKKCFMMTKISTILTLRRRYIMNIGLNFAKMFRKKHLIQQENLRALPKGNRWHPISQWASALLEEENHNNLTCNMEQHQEELQDLWGHYFKDKLLP